MALIIEILFQFCFLGSFKKIKFKLGGKPRRKRNDSQKWRIQHPAFFCSDALIRKQNFTCPENFCTNSTFHREFEKLATGLMTTCYHNYEKQDWVQILVVPLKVSHLVLFIISILALCSILIRASSSSIIVLIKRQCLGPVQIVTSLDHGIEI